MRKALLLLIFISGCTILPSQPVTPEALRGLCLSQTKAYIHYRLKFPHKKVSGNLLFLADPKGYLYLESLSPFGTPIFQASLIHNKVLSIFFPQKEIFVFILEDIPPIVNNSWVYLVFGEIPPSWFSRVKYAKRHGGKITALFELDKDLEAHTTFGSNNYKLMAITLKRSGHTILKINYIRERNRLKGSKFKIPSLHLTLEIAFVSTKETKLDPNFFILYEPPNFQKKMFMLSLH